MRPARGALEPVLRRSFLLAAVYGLAGAIAMSLSRLMDDPDAGWHLRTGQWIVEHLAIPDAELFSAHHASERWVAYSWAYDVLVFGLERAFGLLGPVVLSVAVALGIAHALFALLRFLCGSSGIAAGLTGLGLVAMGPMLYGRSTMFTILFALLLLQALHRATVLGEGRALFAAPVVVAAWANVHVQFVYGLFLYACFLAQVLLESRRDPARRPLAVRMAAVGLACLAATFANPYFHRIYEPLLLYLEQTPLIYGSIQELQPPDFGSVDAWATLGVALLAAWFGLRRIAREPFLVLAFAVAAYVGFRSARDTWFVAATGLPLVARALRREGADAPRPRPWIVAAGTAGMLAIAAWRLDISKDALAANLARNFPVRAADFVEEHVLPGPMVNHYDWGGYLMWRMPERKVSIDGRSWVHDAGFIHRCNRTWSALPGWREDPQIAAAGFVIGARGMPLVRALAGDPRFRLAYEDDVAAVFVREER